MATFLASLSFLVLKHDALVNTNGMDCCNLNDSNIELSELYASEKQQYMRGRKSKIKNAQKVKENLKDMEQLLSSRRCVHIKWNTHEPLMFFFNSGATASITLTDKNTSIEKVVIDTSLCGRFVSEHITDVILERNFWLVTYAEQKLTHIQFTKLTPSSSKLLAAKKVKIANSEPIISTIDLFGPSGRRLEKKLSLNNLKDCVLIWWRFTSGDLWPWMPVNHGAEHNNLLIYSLSRNSIEILCSAKVHGELIYASFSRWHSNRIQTLEEVSENNKLNVNICIYEIASGRCQCTSLSKLPINGHICAFDWNPAEDKVFLADVTKSLFIYDLNKNTTLVTTNSYIMKDIVWHPDSALASTISADGILQCFDAALTLIKMQTSANNCFATNTIKLSSVFCPQKQVYRLMWQSPNTGQSPLIPSDVCCNLSDSLMVTFEGGTFVFVNFFFGHITRNSLTPVELVSQYLKCSCVNEAVCLLQCLDWCHQSELCYQCLSKISTFLLRKPLTAEFELALELCLGSFYNSVSTLNETIVYDYHQQIDFIARRFFHHLLRYRRFEKAFLLAIDLQCRDLFLDLHHVAKEKGESMLAVVSFKHAEELEEPESSSSSQSEGEDSGDSSSTSASSYRSESSFQQPENLHQPMQQITIEDKTGLTLQSNKLYSNNSLKIEPRQYPMVQSTFSGHNGDLASHSQGIDNSFVHLKSQEYQNRYSQRENKLLPVVSLSKPKRPVPTPNSNQRDELRLNYSHRPLNHDSSLGCSGTSLLDDEEDVDAEGRPVKFVHFGIV